MQKRIKNYIFTHMLTIQLKPALNSNPTDKLLIAKIIYEFMIVPHGHINNMTYIVLPNTKNFITAISCHRK